MIRMISGATRIGSHIMTPQSGPFEAPAETENRLVRAGVAEYCGIPPVATPTEPLEGMELCENVGEVENRAEGQETSYLDPKQLAELTKAKLVALAESMGIDCSKLRTKARLIAAVSGAPSEDCTAEPEDDGEQPPELTAEGPVV